MATAAERTKYRHTMSLARVLTLKGALTGKAITVRHT